MEYTKEQKRKVAQWMASHLHDEYVDEADIAEQYGDDYIPSIEAVIEYLADD